MESGRNMSVSLCFRFAREGGLMRPSIAASVLDTKHWIPRVSTSPFLKCLAHVVFFKIRKSSILRTSCRRHDFTWCQPLATHASKLFENQMHVSCWCRSWPQVGKLLISGLIQHVESYHLCAGIPRGISPKSLSSEANPSAEQCRLSQCISQV